MRIVCCMLREMAVVVWHMGVDVFELDVGVIFGEEGVKLGSEIGECWSVIGVFHPAVLHQLVAVEIICIETDSVMNARSLSLSLSLPSQCMQPYMS